jgi:deazaflavin-dependent oxidoreductase (nitroreductase family)
MLHKLIMSPAGWAFDRFMVRWTGWSPLSALFARAAGIKNESRNLALVTKGRTSGKKRTVALSYFEIDGHMLVVGSAGGAPQDPQWVRNLRADPSATIYVARKPRRVTARIADGAEREAIWRTLSAQVPTYAAYQAAVTRQIPLVILDRH